MRDEKCVPTWDTFLAAMVNLRKYIHFRCVLSQADDQPGLNAMKQLNRAIRYILYVTSQQ